MGLECEKIRGKVKRKYRENQWKRERKNPPKSKNGNGDATTR